MRLFTIATITIALSVTLFAVNAAGVQPGPSRILISDRVVSESQKYGYKVIKTLLYSRAFPNSIGNSVLICDEIGSARGPIPPGAMQCTGTYRFANGNIIVSGYMGKRGLYTLAVTGGTGLYSNAGAGQMAAVTIDLSPREQQLEFTLYST